MKTILLFVFSISIGLRDAPAASAGIPTTYNTSHPRLPHPDPTYLSNLAANPTAIASYNSTADAWDSTNPGVHQQLRRLLIAYLANKAAGNSARTATYLGKIKDLAKLGGMWGQLYFTVSDGVGDGTLTVTSATANFQTGCGGGPCVYYSVNNIPYFRNTIVDAHTVVLQPFASGTPNPTGTGLTIVTTAGYGGYQDLEIAMAYDWIYNDLDTATRTAFLQQIEAQLLFWETTYVNTGLSPYNDQLYGHLTPSGLIAALAIYPDFDSANPSGGVCATKPCGTYHINWMIDKWFNAILPVWKQVFGPDGGGWHENWDSYAHNSLTTWIVPSILSWQVATGDPIFPRESWLKNYSYWTMYMTRPDFTLEHIGDVAAGLLLSEYDLQASINGVGLGSLNGLAEIYNDPVLRGWARLVNDELPSGPSGFEPSAWPFYAPDNSSNPVADRSSLPTTRNFTGWGVIAARSGWGEDDTAVTLKYGDNFWSHEHFDAGSFTISHRGNLAIESGDYRPGFTSLHELQYARQTIAHNTLTITDPSDVYPSELFTANYGDSNQVTVPLANDGGQRRVGSPYNEHQELFSNLMGSPNDFAAWQAGYDYFHTGTLLAYTSTPQYTYASIDITPAYNNPESVTSPNSGNRTSRVSKVIRSMLFIPPGYVVVYDAVNSTNPAFKKKWLLHSVNAPIISGNRYEIDRAELVTPQPYADLWTLRFPNQLKHAAPTGQYQYGGKLVGWMVQPTGAISSVGGPGKEFWVDDPKTPGAGTNWNQCELGQCTGAWAFLAPNTPDVMQPSNSYAPVEPGSWRIEESPGSAANQDYFLNVMLATNIDDTNVPATVTGTSDANNLGATWSDSNNTYTVVFPRGGTGGHITVTGTQNINANLPTGTAGSTPTIASFSATPPTVASGQSSTLSWTVSNATSLSIDNGVGAQTSLLSGSATVTPGSTITYTLTATNANGSVTAPTTVVVSGLIDSQPPTVPTNLSAAAVSSSQINLSWTASTDNVGVAGYKIFRNGAQVGTSTVVSYSDTGLAAATPYTYTVSAFDAAGNNSSASTSASATTLSSGGGTPIPAGTWVNVLTNGIPEQADGWEKLIYASSIKKSVYFGGYHGTNEDGNQALVGYDLASNSWSVLDLAAPLHSENMPENGHPVGMFAYNPNQKTVIYYCCPGTSADEKPDHTWWFDTVGQVGRDKFASPTPGMIQEASAAFDVARNTFVLFGSGAGTWTYDPAGNSWQQKSPLGTPPSAGIGMPSMTYDSTNQKVYLFGGRSGFGTTATYYNDLYTYDLGTNTWTHLTPTGSPPSPRIKAGFAYDSTNNIILLYGGHNDSGLSNSPPPLNDTWAYDPVANTWTQLSPPTSPPVGNSGPFERLAYDSDDNVFVLVQAGAGGYAGGGSTYAGAQTWLFRYAGGGPNAGTAGLSNLPTPGGINRNIDGWASEPALAANGTSLYAGWMETGKPFDTSPGGWPHAYASQLTGSAWAAMGSSYLSLDSEFSGTSESHDPSVAFAGGSLWMAWYKQNTGSITSAKIFAKMWSGASWSGGMIGLGTSATNSGSSDPRFSQGRPQLADVNGTPHIAFLEVDRTFYPWNTLVYVKSFDGAQWNLKGSGPVSVNSLTSGDTATSVSIASDGTNPYVAWTEGTNLSFTAGTATAPQVRVARWTGSAWLPVGGSLNIDTANGWASDAVITYLAGKPYVAWIERSVSGNAQLFVKTTTDGTNWTLVGTGTLNNNTSSGWAFRPSLATDGTNLYVGWIEQSSLGQKPQGYVSRWNGTVWNAVGASLNSDPLNGSAQRLRLAVYNNQPVAAWGEVNMGTMRQVFVKAWNGSTWTILTGTVSGSLNPCDLNGDGLVSNTDVLLAISQVLGTAACTNADLTGDGLCTVVDLQRIINASLGGACRTGK